MTDPAYQRLSLPVTASPYAVLRAAVRALHPDTRAVRGFRAARKRFYLRMLCAGSVANIFDGCEEDFLRFVHAGLALKFCSSIATTSVSALGPMLKARSTMRASPRMSPVKLKIAAWPLRRARMTSKPLIVA